MMWEVCREGLWALFFWALTIAWSRLMGTSVEVALGRSSLVCEVGVMAFNANQALN